MISCICVSLYIANQPRRINIQKQSGDKAALFVQGTPGGYISVDKSSLASAIMAYVWQNYATDHPLVFDKEFEKPQYVWHGTYSADPATFKFNSNVGPELWTVANPDRNQNWKWVFQYSNALFGTVGSKGGYIALLQITNMDACYNSVPPVTQDGGVRLNNPASAAVVKRHSYQGKYIINLPATKHSFFFLGKHIFINYNVFDLYNLCQI